MIHFWRGFLYFRQLEARIDKRRTYLPSNRNRGRGFAGAKVSGHTFSSPLRQSAHVGHTKNFGDPANRDSRFSFHGAIHRKVMTDVPWRCERQERSGAFESKEHLRRCLLSFHPSACSLSFSLPRSPSSSIPATVANALSTGN